MIQNLVIAGGTIFFIINHTYNNMIVNPSYVLLIVEDIRDDMHLCIIVIEALLDQIHFTLSSRGDNCMYVCDYITMNIGQDTSLHIHLGLFSVYIRMRQGTQAEFLTLQLSALWLPYLRAGSVETLHVKKH